MKNKLPRLGDSKTTTHLYHVEVLTPEGRATVEVDANTRTQAGNTAKKAGYTVCNVNMVG